MSSGLDDRESGFTMFSDEEVRDMSGVKRDTDHVEVTCGCTSHRYGDAVGRLRVFLNGSLEITCECHQEKMSPAAFEKHSGRETGRKWKNNVWVIVNGEKVGLRKTVLLKFYNDHLSKAANNSSSHRDEFVPCSLCNKQRRFRLRTKEECRIHHDAFLDPNWQCAHLPFHKITCDDEEERASRRVYRGCTRAMTCKGCTSCVCFGCHICRFSDCTCQICTDFTRNAKA